MPQYEVAFVQEGEAEIISWEFQYTENGITWQWVQSVEPINDCLNCYKAIVEVPSYFYAVRSRAINDHGDVSEWSNPVYLPEPSAFIALAIACALLAWLHKLRDS